MAMKPEDVFSHRAKLAILHRDAYRQLCSTAEGREETTLAIANTTYETAESTFDRKKKKKKRGVSKVKIYQPKATAEAQDPETGVWWPVDVVSQNYTNGSARVRVAGDHQAPEWSTTSLRNPSKRMAPVKKLPKGRSIWTEDHSKAIILSNTDSSDKIEDPSYFTFDRLYSMYVDLKKKNRLLESNLNQSKSELRTQQVKGVNHIDDLLRMSSIAVTYSVSGAVIKPVHIRNTQDLHNVIVRQQAADVVEIKGGARECQQATAALKNLYPEVSVSKSSAPAEGTMYVDDCVRIRPLQKTGFITEKVITDSGTSFVVRHDSLDGGVETNTYPETELEVLASPVLWCSALKVSLPVTDSAHVVILKKEIKSLTSKLERATNLATQRRSGQREAQADSFNLIAEQVGKYNQKLDTMTHERDELDNTRSLLTSAQQKISELEASIKEVREHGISAAKSLRKQLSEEKATRLRAEDSLTLEGLWQKWSENSPEYSSSSADKVIELVSTIDPYSSHQKLMYSEVLEGKEVFGKLQPAKVSEMSPVLCAEYHGVLSNDSEIWLGRTDTGRISITYREPGGLSHQDTFCKIVHQPGDRHHVKLPTMVGGSCPRCHTESSFASQTPSEKKTESPPRNRGFRNSETQTAPAPTSPEGLEDTIRELQASLLSKDRELQTAVDALKIRDVTIASPDPSQQQSEKRQQESEEQSAAKKQKEQQDRQQAEAAEERRRSDQRAQKAREEEEQAKRQKEQRERQQAEEAKKQQEAEQRARKVQREEEARRQEEINEKVRKEAEEAKKKQEAEQRAREEEEEAEKARKEAEEARKKQQEAEQRAREEEEAEKARKDAEEAKKKQQEAEQRAREEEEAEKARKEAEEAKKQQEAEQRAREEEEAEKARKEAEEAKKKQQEAEQRAREEEEAEKARKEAEEAKEKQEAEQRAREEEAKRQKEIEDAKKQQKESGSPKKPIMSILSSIDKEGSTPHLALIAKAFLT